MLNNPQFYRTLTFLFFLLMIAFSKIAYANLLSLSGVNPILPIPMNLKGHPYPESTEVSRVAERLAKEAIESKQPAKIKAYLLSMPLISFALQGDSKQYDHYAAEMDKLLHQIEIPDNTWKAWLLGRMELAQISLGRTSEAKATSAAIDHFLKTAPTDEFSVWARAYQALVDKKTYEHLKPKMLQEAKDLMAEYKKLLLDPKQMQAKIHEAFSNAMWANGMINLAAAANDDPKTFALSNENILTLTHQLTLIEAACRLQRTASSNDYPDWYKAILALSASTIGNKQGLKVYEALLSNLKNSLKNPDFSKTAPAEWMLTTVFVRLAEKRMEYQLELAAIKSQQPLSSSSIRSTL